MGILCRRLKKKSSYTWKSILAGVQTIRRGYIWRIGDGSKVRIWDDPWLPGNSRRIFTPRGNNLLSNVSDLIDPATGDWDEKLVNQTFMPIDSARVLAIPLPLFEMEDFIAWSPSKTGLFSVRSAYHEEWEFQYGAKLGDHANRSSGNDIWKSVWDLKCPPKVKIFIWRALHGAIPCHAILVGRHIKVKPHCATCNLGPDNIQHLLFECPIASEVWGLLGIDEIVKKACLVDRAGEAVLEHLLCLSNDEIAALGKPKLRETIVTSSWYLWFEWRKRKHGEKPLEAPQIALAVRGLAEFFVISCTPKERVKRNCWKKPRREYMKLNIDASFDDDVLKGTVGAILRDHKGQFIAAANEKIDFAMDSFMAEAMAVRFGMNLARTVGCGKLELESDNLDVIESLKAGSSSSPASAMFDDCFLMSQEFTHVLFQHCFRESNCVAHELAKLAKFSPPCTWLESP